jgi:hypothetical protein
VKRNYSASIGTILRKRKLIFIQMSIGPRNYSGDKRNYSGSRGTILGAEELFWEQRNYSEFKRNYSGVGRCYSVRGGRMSLYIQPSRTEKK